MGRFVGKRGRGRRETKTVKNRREIKSGNLARRVRSKRTGMGPFFGIEAPAPVRATICIRFPMRAPFSSLYDFQHNALISYSLPSGDSYWGSLGVCRTKKTPEEFQAIRGFLRLVLRPETFKRGYGLKGILIDTFLYVKGYIDRPPYPYCQKENPVCGGRPVLQWVSSLAWGLSLGMRVGHHYVILFEKDCPPLHIRKRGLVPPRSLNHTNQTLPQIRGLVKMILSTLTIIRPRAPGVL